MNIAIWKRVFRAPFGAALGSCILLEGILMAVTAPLLPIVLAERVGMDKSQIAIYFLLRTLIGIAVTLGSGYLSDGIIARYKLVLVGGAVSALGTMMIAVARLPLTAYVADALSVGIIVLFPQLFAVAKAGIVAGWEREEQTMGITALRTLFSFGYILGTALASVMAHTDVQAAFFLFGGAMLALTIYSTWVLRRIEAHIARQDSAEAAQDQPSKAPSVILPAYALIVPLVSLIVLVSADSTRQTYLALVMFQLTNDASIAPLMFGVTAAFELITMSLMGSLSGKIGEKSTIALGALFGTLYFVIHSLSQSLPLLYLANAVYAIFVAVLYGVAMAYVQGLMEHRAGMGGSLYVSVLNVGSLVGILSPLLVSGYDQTIFIIPALLCLGGAALLMLGDRTAQIQRRLSEAQAIPHL
jgi:MFS transporter, SET family, sugar efflux transporter